MNQPTIGRIVHYKNHEGETWPAMIIRVNEEGLLLRVFEAQSQDNASCKAGDMAAGPREAENGQWWWPERL